MRIGIASVVGYFLSVAVGHAGDLPVVEMEDVAGYPWAQCQAYYANPPDGPPIIDEKGPIFGSSIGCSAGPASASISMSVNLSVGEGNEYLVDVHLVGTHTDSGDIYSSARALGVLLKGFVVDNATDYSIYTILGPGPANPENSGPLGGGDLAAPRSRTMIAGLNITSTATAGNFDVHSQSIIYFPQVSVFLNWGNVQGFDLPSFPCEFSLLTNKCLLDVGTGGTSAACGAAPAGGVCFDLATRNELRQRVFAILSDNVTSAGNGGRNEQFSNPRWWQYYVPVYSTDMGVAPAKNSIIVDIVGNFLPFNGYAYQTGVDGQNKTDGGRVVVATSTTQEPFRDLDDIAATIVHEVGHAVGLAHTADNSVMGKASPDRTTAFASEKTPLLGKSFAGQTQNSLYHFQRYGVDLPSTLEPGSCDSALCRSTRSSSFDLDDLVLTDAFEEALPARWSVFRDESEAFDADDSFFFLLSPFTFGSTLTLADIGEHDVLLFYGSTSEYEFYLSSVADPTLNTFTIDAGYLYGTDSLYLIAFEKASGNRSVIGSVQVRSIDDNNEICAPFAVFVAVGESRSQSTPLSGSCQLLKTGAGLFTLASGNTYTRGTMVLQGTVIAHDDSGLGSSDGKLTIDGGRFETAASFSMTRSVAIGTSGGTIYVPGQDELTLFGTISGTGDLEKAGTGALVVEGDNGNSFLHATRVLEGELRLLGSLGGSVDVAAAARLTGNGVLAGKLVVRGGEVSPGISSVDGMLLRTLQFEEGIFKVEFGGIASGFKSDFLVIMETAEISGGSLNAVPLGSQSDFYFRQIYPILLAGESISGSFANSSAFVRNAHDANLLQRLSLSPDSKSMFLEVRRLIDWGAAGATLNEKEIGRVLSSFELATRDDQWAQVLDGLSRLPAPQQREFFNALGGEGAVGAIDASLLLSNGFLSILSNRAGYRQSSISAAEMLLHMGNDQSDSLAGSLLIAAQPANLRANLDRRESGSSVLWLQTYGSVAKIQADPSKAHLDFDARGLVAGFESSADGVWTIGIAVGQGEAETKVRARQTEVRNTATQAAPYLLLNDERVFGQAILGLTSGDIEVTRRSPLGDTAVGETDLNSIALRTLIGWRLTTDTTFALEPIAAVGYERVWRDGYGETGAGVLNLIVDSVDSQLGTVELGLRTRDEIQLGRTLMRPEANVGWRANFGDTDRYDAAAFSGVPGSSFVLEGESRPDHLVLLGAGVSVLSEEFEITARYDSSWGERFNEQRASLDVSVHW